MNCRHLCLLFPRRLLLTVLAGLMLTALVLADEPTGPWNLPQLKQTPAAEFGPESGMLRPVYYSGEEFQGKPTRIFAWYAQPAGAGPFPGVVLVHGGGGRAFREWALHWAQRGYAALAMDLAGHGPDGRLPDGGPDQSDESKFRSFEDDQIGDMWTWHAVSAVIRGHSLLAAQPAVDSQRIGITGISWGGYLTCIVSGLDDRLKAAVPVYGCGFLADNSVWREPRFTPMSPELRERWVKHFDPSRYLSRVRCPILFLNGTNDFAYPMDSYRKSYELVSEEFRTIAMIPRLPHGHIWTFPEVDVFMDSQLKAGQPMAKLGPPQAAEDRVSAMVSGPVEIRQAHLHYTLDQGPWQKREWKELPAMLSAGEVSAVIPDGATAFYLAVTDSREVTVSTAHLLK
ncbi:MAG: hypothetical protein RLZZ436_3792 [Planctomycetota bacterium]|jgi:dienelactone hydrolase